MPTTDPAGTQTARDGLERLLPAVGLTGLALVPVAVAVGVRWLAFATEGATNDATALAIALPPPDLVFTGVRYLATPYLWLVAAFGLLGIALRQRHEPWHRAFDKVSAAMTDVKARLNVLQDTQAEIRREQVKPNSSVSRVNQLTDDATRQAESLKTAFDEMQRLHQESELLGDPLEGRSYPIQKWGIAFISKRAFVLFVGLCAFYVLSVVATGFPSSAAGSVVAVVTAVLVLIGHVLIRSRPSLVDCCGIGDRSHRNHRDCFMVLSEPDCRVPMVSGCRYA